MNTKYGAKFAPVKMAVLEQVRFSEPDDGIVTIPQEQLDSYMEFLFGKNNEKYGKKTK